MKRHEYRPKRARGAHLMRRTCPHCGKQAYASRADAKVQIRRLYPGEKNMNAYRPASCGGVWHIGHLAPGTRDYYNGARAARECPVL